MRRERDPSDRRRQTLTLTARGRDLLAACTEAAAEIDAELTEGLGPEEAEVLRGAMRKLARRNGLPADQAARARIRQVMVIRELYQRGAGPGAV